MDRTPAKPDSSTGSVRVTLATGKHRWTFDCDRTGRDAMDEALRSLVRHPGLGFTDADALIVRRAVAEGLGLVPQIRPQATQDRPPTGR